MAPEALSNDYLRPMRHRWSAISPEAELRSAGQTGRLPLRKNKKGVGPYVKKEKGPIRSLHLWCAGLPI
jgi:hypothetical protein